MNAANWIALAGVVVALLALGWTVYKDRRDEQRRRDQELAVNDLQASQADVLERLADATKALGDLAGGQAALANAHEQGAQLSASFTPRDERNGRRLVIRNLGPGGAQLRNVVVPDDTHIRIKRTGLENEVVELLPNEEHRIHVVIATGYRVPIHVMLEWVDGRGQQIRDQALMLP